MIGCQQGVRLAQALDRLGQDEPGAFRSIVRKAPAQRLQHRLQVYGRIGEVEEGLGVAFQALGRSGPQPLEVDYPLDLSRRSVSCFQHISRLI